MSQKKILIKPQTAVKAKTTDAKQRENFPTKVIVRRLPPSLTTDSFLEEVSPLAEHNYFHFEPADKSLGPYSMCRAVINFKNVEDLYIFREKFDGYVFVDSRGTEYPAVVEYAPYQKIPQNSRKDHRENTIDDDPEYKKFLESLENADDSAEPVLSIKEVLEQIDSKQKERLAAQNSETPLLAFINKFKLEKRRAQEKLKEERRLRDLERKRLKDEERRKREKERREIEDKHKGSKSSTAADGDRRDTKKTQKPGGKPGGPYNSDIKSADKSVKGASLSSLKGHKDDIIVRTLPSSKSKTAKQTASTDKRPTSGKSMQITSKSNPSSKTGTSKTSNSKESAKSDNVAPQTVLSGKQELPVKSAGSKYGRSEVTVRSIDRKSTDKSRFVKGKSAEQGSARDSSKDINKSSSANRPEDSSRTDELSERLGSVKLNDVESGGASGSDRSSKSSDKMERSSSATSTDSRSMDSSEGDGDRPRTARNMRYKDRPERAMYNPGARAAERRQRQQVVPSKVAGNDDTKTE